MKIPSQKQIDFANEIAYVLGVDFSQGSSDFTAVTYYHFINNNIQKYHEIKASDPNYADDYWLYEEQF